MFSYMLNSWVDWVPQLWMATNQDCFEFKSVENLMENHSTIFSRSYIDIDNYFFFLTVRFILYKCWGPLKVEGYVKEKRVCGEP